MHKLLLKNQSGLLALQILIIGFIAITLIIGFTVWTDAYVRSVGRDTNNALAFTIAEAGIEYYRWHLAHAPQDFTDGTGQAGPYVHPYYDKDGTQLGQFSLQITAPASGTTIATIRSSATLTMDPTISKIIEVRMGLPSFARYSVASNSDIRFGAGTNVYGQLHSNGGIRFDGVAYNIVSSAQTSYNDPDHSGANDFGVHTHVTPTDPTPPATVPVRNDVFVAGRQFPVPAVDFNGITQDLANIKTAASSSGYYRGPSGGSNRGYEIVLKTNDTFDIFRVNTVRTPPGSCSNTQGQAGWGTWTPNSTTSIATNVAFPANGLIFIEDDVWVRGQINTARLTIAAGRFPVNPATYANITVNQDVRYTNYDGSDVLSLMTQNNVNVGLFSNNNLFIDAALVAQNGRVGRYYYPTSCTLSGTNYYVRNSLSLFGMLGSNQRYGWAYTDGTGYVTRNITYDGNLLYGPPPSFPITAGQYDIIRWDEVK